MAVGVTGGPADKPISNKNKPSGTGRSVPRVALTPKQIEGIRQRNRPSTTKRPAGLMGSADVMERRLKANKQGRPLTGRSQGAVSGGQQSESDEFMDLLNSLLGGGGGGGGGGGYSAGDIAAAQAAMGSNRARMEALYRRYAEDIAAQEAGIGQTFDRSGAALGGIYDTSVANVNAAYDAARAAQTQQLRNLGMTEQTPVQNFGNQTGATTSLQNLRAAVLAQNEASRRAAITNQRLASEAASREGVQALSQYDMQAAQALAEMQAARPSGGGGGGGGGGLSPNQFASLALQKMRMDQDAQIAAAKIASSQRPAPNMQAALDFAATSRLSPDEIKRAQFFLSNQ